MALTNNNMNTKKTPTKAGVTTRSMKKAANTDSNVVYASPIFNDVDKQLKHTKKELNNVKKELARLQEEARNRNAPAAAAAAPAAAAAAPAAAAAATLAGDNAAAVSSDSSSEE